MKTMSYPSYDGNDKNIYVVYNFKQVADEIMLIMYVDAIKGWQKIAIEYDDGCWNTAMLNNYFSAESYKCINQKLSLIFRENKVLKQDDEKDFMLLLEHVFILFNCCS